MWNPELYLRYSDERGRPFHELVAQIGAVNPRLVLDLGCGPGNLTETLTQRWPDARIHGVDSSQEMIAQAQASTKGVTYEVADVLTYEPPEEVDVIVTNATLQWVPGHDDLLRKWVRPGRWIAMQVPANFDAPSHLALREVASRPRWASRLSESNRRPVGDAVHYARLLRDAGCVVDAWETNYIHQLPVGQRHPVLTWMTGTALRPIRKVLNDAEWEEFTSELEGELVDRYPPNGVVDFAFLRVFTVAHAPRTSPGGRPTPPSRQGGAPRRRPALR